MLAFKRMYINIADQINFYKKILSISTQKYIIHMNIILKTIFSLKMFIYSIFTMYIKTFKGLLL